MLRGYLRALKDIFLPRLCYLCEEKISQGYLCPRCLSSIAFVMPPFCRYCGRGLGNQTDNLCKKCLNKTYPYDILFPVTVYKEPMVSLIHLFKYKQCDYLGEFLSSLMVEHLVKIGFMASGYHYLTAVPLHPHKLKIRGYNQAGLLAYYLSKYFKIPLNNDIIAAANLRFSQTKLPKKARQENVEGVFKTSGDLHGKNIILVDDIVTTGATIQACCVSLRQRGAKQIAVFALSRTFDSLK